MKYAFNLVFLMKLSTFEEYSQNKFYSQNKKEE